MVRAPMVVALPVAAGAQAPAIAPLAACGPGAPAATAWQGFQPGRVAGMTFEARLPR